MATLIGIVLLLVFAYHAYGTVRRFLAEPPAADTAPEHRALREDLGAGLDTGDDPAEAREAELASELLAGEIDPATYRNQMAELAQAGHIQTGGPR
jgi:hypothetical protein